MPVYSIASSLQILNTCQDIAHTYVILHCNHFSILSKSTDCEIGFAENGEMATVENNIDVGNILTKIWLCL